MRCAFGSPVIRFLPALSLWLVTATYLAMAYQYKPVVRAFPVGVAWVMLVLLTLDLLSNTDTAAGQALMRWLNPAAAHPAAPPPRQVWAVLSLALFAALLVLVGILLAVPIYLFTALRWRQKPYRACVLGAAGATLFVWLLFSVVLRIALYPGLLFGGA